MLIGFTILLALLLVVNAACYVFLTPGRPAAPVSSRPLYRQTARAALTVAAVLSILRLPYVVIPYLCKLIIFAAARPVFDRHWRTSHAIQLARLAGDFANGFLTTALMAILASRVQMPGVWAIVSLSAAAEAVRLALEKGQMLISAAWQTIPHRWIASRVGGRYGAYYSLGDADRLAAVMGYLRERAAGDAETLRLVGYTRGFRIVPGDHALEAGDVRDVAAGEVFIHRGWTADPWLLIGLALRRGAWLFDPRYLRRPFYYRSESNRLAALAVLSAAAYSPPYALYQLGHEIKAARYAVYHQLCRWIGWNNELWVLESGLYPFERVIGWLDRLARHAPRPERRALWSDEEVVAAYADVRVPVPDAEIIARRYVYPVCYVEDVLIGKIRAGRGTEG